MTFRSTSRGLRRSAAALLALVQFGVSTAVVVADASLDGEQVGQTAHVESLGNEECATHHDHLFCQVVRSLAAATRGHGAPTLQADGAFVSLEALPAEHDVRAVATFSGASGPRAPPLV